MPARSVKPGQEPEGMREVTGRHHVEGRQPRATQKQTLKRRGRGDQRPPKDIRSAPPQVCKFH